jgi:uncharacterized protein
MKRPLCYLMLTVLIIGYAGWGRAANPQKKEVTFASYSSGSVAYICFYATSEFINKESPWLRAVSVETTGTTENIRRMIKDPQQTVGFATNVSLWMPNRAKAPWKERIPIRSIGTWGVVGTTWWAKNPAIRTVADLKGKRVGLPYPGAFYETFLEGILAAHGMTLKDIKIIYGLFDKSADFLKAGTIDVACGGTVGPAWALAPATSDLLTTTTIYPIRFTEHDFEVAREKTGYPFYRAVIPKDKCEPKLKEDLTVLSLSNSFACHADMDGEVVSEILRVLSKRYADYAELHASLKGWTPEGIADSGVPESYYHPAALKWFKDRKIAIPKYKLPE